VPDWHWEPVTDDLLDRLPPAALAAVRQVAEELTVRESMIFLDGREFTGEPPGLRTVQRGPLMLVYLTDVRSERVVIIQVNWIGCPMQPRKFVVSAAAPVPHATVSIGSWRFLLAVLPCCPAARQREPATC